MRPLEKISISNEDHRSRDIRNSLSFTSNFWFGAIQYLKEFSYAVAHARVHVGLRALDVIVQVVTERLNKTDSLLASVSFGKVSRSKD